MSLPWILLIVLLVIQFICLPSLLKRAGLDGWKGYVPVLHWLTWLKMINRPWWWVFLLLVPGVNLIMLTIMHVETAICFSRLEPKDQWFAGLLPWVYLPKLAFQDKEAKFIGARDWTKKKKSFGREWGEAIIFAIVAASVIRTFFFEAFTIPTPSMEGSMLVGDYLFVSKMSYGAKSPQTPMSIPFIHNTIPSTLTDSYVDWFTMPYFRLPALGKVDRYDPVVFNFPHGDTIVVHPFWMGHDYYGILRQEAFFMARYDQDAFRADPSKYMNMARTNLEEKKLCYTCQRDQNLAQNGKPVVIGGTKARPIDKCENYVKRCIGLPGEDLQIINQAVHINGAPIDDPEFMQVKYRINFSVNNGLQTLRKVISFVASEVPYDAVNAQSVVIPLTKADLETVRNMKIVASVEPVTYPETEFNQLNFFPNFDAPAFTSWSWDNYGPIHIPKAGETVTLDENNVRVFERVIRVYEGNELQILADGVYINGSKTDKYTFKFDYYWMMGDNRHNSADSRVWGFVPETHVVGKPVFCWMSKMDEVNHGKSGFRFERMFRLVD